MDNLVDSSHIAGLSNQASPQLHVIAHFWIIKNDKLVPARVTTLSFTMGLQIPVIETTSIFYTVYDNDMFRPSVLQYASVMHACDLFCFNVGCNC